MLHVNINLELFFFVGHWLISVNVFIVVLLNISKATGFYDDVNTNNNSHSQECAIEKQKSLKNIVLCILCTKCNFLIICHLSCLANIKCK